MTAFLPTNLSVAQFLTPQLLGEEYLVRVAIEAVVINSAMLWLALPMARLLWSHMIPGGSTLPGQWWQQWIVALAAFLPVRAIVGATVAPVLAELGIPRLVAVAMITVVMTVVMTGVVFPTAFRWAASWLTMPNPSGREWFTVAVVATALLFLALIGAMQALLVVAIVVLVTALVGLLVTADLMQDRGGLLVVADGSVLASDWQAARDVPGALPLSR